MKVDTQIKNKRILLLGSCGSLGEAHTRILAEQGARLIIADQPGSPVLDKAKDLGLPGIEIDARNEMQMVTGIAQAGKIHEGLDGSIFNAAITSESLESSQNKFPDFEEYPLRLWQQAIDVNLTGAFLFARESGKILKDGGGGSMILVSSVYGIVGPDHRIYEGQSFRSFPAYSASKAGIIGLVRWLSTWWGAHGIRVNSVCPGGVFNDHQNGFVKSYSDRVPLGRMASSQEVTGMLIYLLSDSSSYCTGQNLAIDGGLSAW